MTKKNHAKLICDVSEINGLFTDASSLQSFLQKMVELISDHMYSPVCSIYLFYEDRQELILKATRGLNIKSIDRVKMKVDEGLTGLALKELKPICERNASQNPHFKYFPGIGEERYESFLAVPIVRGVNRIGVMVIQNTKSDYFSDEDIQILQAITSQLATTIETTKILMSLNDNIKPTTFSPQLLNQLKFVRGRVGASGYAVGPGEVLKKESIKDLAQQAIKQKISLQDFQQVVLKTEMQLDQLQKRIEEKLSDVAALIFSAQILMLKDKDFLEAIIERIKKKMDPIKAVVQVVEQYMHRFEQMENAYIREKAKDVEDIGIRLLRNLVGKVDQSLDIKGHVVIAQDLLPSDALKLYSENIAGIILLSGGVSSHLAILVRSLNIPLIIVDEPSLLTLPDDVQIVLDAHQGNVYINPSQDVVATLKQREKNQQAINKYQSSVKEESLTKDHTSIKLLANINLLGDIQSALAFKAQGIGLYRTEFPFMVRSDFPSEEEQLRVYQKLIQLVKGKEVTFRTLDIGGDKVLSYYNSTKEENPFLGMRSIRFSLKYQDIFVQQLRAILRAAADHPQGIKIMFPMISSVDEFLKAKSILLSTIKELSIQKIPCVMNPAIGMMVELPCVIELIEDFAKEADFFSIGTNDLIQYMLAVDRTNEKVADLYLPYHPAILRAIKKVVDVCVQNKKELTICGDMAHQEEYLYCFLGMGIRRISLDSQYLPRVQQFINRVDLKTAAKDVKSLLNQVTLKEIKLSLENYVAGVS